MSKNLSDIFPPTEIGGGGGGIEEAPKTGKLHGRKDGAWEEFDPGQLETGNQDGEILTWDTATAKWVDNDTMIVQGGNVLVSNGGRFYLMASGGISPFIKEESNGLVFWADGSERMRIDSSGRVGIGTDNPSQKLDVNGAVSIQKTAFLEHTSASAFWQISGGVTQFGSSTDTPVDFFTNNIRKMRIDASGNVGIGTDSPNATLAFGGSSDVAFNTSLGSTGTYGEIKAFNTLAPSNPATNIRFIRDVASVGNDGAVCFDTVNTERMRIDCEGRVGIGTNNPNAKLDVEETTANTTTRSDQIRIVAKSSGTAGVGFGSNIFFLGERASGSLQAMGRIGFAASTNTSSNLSSDFVVETANSGVPAERMRIDSSGRVGIGGTPSRSTKEIEDEAEATLRNWDSKDKKPTKAELIKQLTERTIGGGSAKLQVAGDGHFSGTVNAQHHQGAGYFYRDSHSGVTYGVNSWIPLSSSNVISNGAVDIGESGRQFKDAHFSGTIYGKVADVPDHVKNITPTQIANWDAGTGGGGGGATTDGRISDTQIVHWDQAYSWGNHASAGYSKSDTTYTAGNGLSLSGNQFTMSGSYTGNFTATGNITAYSDERLKDSVKTAPSGLVDQLRGVEFSWKESGKADAGVIAQEVEQVLPHLVADHEDGMKSVNYNGLVAYLIEEVKALRAEVEALKG